MEDLIRELELLLAVGSPEQQAQATQILQGLQEEEAAGGVPLPELERFRQRASQLSLLQPAVGTRATARGTRGPTPATQTEGGSPTTTRGQIALDTEGRATTDPLGQFGDFIADVFTGNPSSQNGQGRNRSRAGAAREQAVAEAQAAQNQAFLQNFDQTVAGFTDPNLVPQTQTPQAPAGQPARTPVQSFQTPVPPIDGAAVAQALFNQQQQQLAQLDALQIGALVDNDNLQRQQELISLLNVPTVGDTTGLTAALAAPQQISNQPADLRGLTQLAQAGQVTVPNGQQAAATNINQRQRVLGVESDFVGDNIAQQERTLELLRQQYINEIGRSIMTARR